MSRAELIDRLLGEMDEEDKVALHEQVHEAAVAFAKQFARDKLYSNVDPADCMTAFCVTNRMVEKLSHNKPNDVMTGDSLHELLMLAFVAGFVWHDQR